MDIPESKRTNSADRTADSAADWNSLPDNVIEKIAGYVVAKNGCFLKSRYGLSISRRWRWIALRSIKTRTHLQISPSSNMTTPAGNPSFSSVHRELEKKDFSSLKHLEVKNISLPVTKLVDQVPAKFDIVFRINQNQSKGQSGPFGDDSKSIISL